MSAEETVAELAIASANDLGESIVWNSETDELAWVDIHRGKLERRSADMSRSTADLPARIGAIGLRASGGFVAAFTAGFILLDANGRLDSDLIEIEPDLPTTRLNDGKVDRQGRFICGGMDEAQNQLALSAVYRLDPDGTPHRIIDRVACANSIAFSPDGALMYFSDMPSARILVYEYDVDEGIPHDPKVFADGTEHPGLPDGSTVDADGCLWNARWGAGTVVRYTPDGSVDAVVRVPATNPTCVAFGDADLSTLYITSARFGRTDQQLAREPLAGGIFAVTRSARGVREPHFAD